MPRPDSIISLCCRLALARELGVEPSELKYAGAQKGSGYELILFTVDRPGDPMHRTTRSVKVET